MDIKQLWPDESLVLAIGGEKLVSMINSSCFSLTVCFFCNFYSEDPALTTFDLDVNTGNFSCSHCHKNGGILDLVSMIKYGEEVANDVIRDLVAYEFRILPKVQLGVYRHFKGKDYLVYGVTRDADDDGHWRVQYRPLYGDYLPTSRTLQDFFAPIDQNTARFSFSYPA